MRILLVNYEYPPIGAGAANATYFMAQALAVQNHQVVVLTSGLNTSDEVTTDGAVRVHRLSTGRKLPDRASFTNMLSFAIKARRKIDRVVTDNNIEKAIIFFTIPCGHVGLRLKSRFNIDYLISLRGGDVPGLVPEIINMHKVLTPLRRKILKNAKAVIANDTGLAQLSEKADTTPVKVIHNGVDTSFFQPFSENKESNQFTILFVGRFSTQKNLFYLLSQVDAFRRKVSIPVQLVIVGDGPLSGQIHEHAEKLNLTEIIQWKGWLSKQEIVSQYQAATVFINPSFYEGMPNVLLEAMACGLPVLASNVRGNDTLVKHGETGFLFNLNEPDALFSTLMHCADNMDLLLKFGSNARNSAIENFSWHKVADEYLKLL